MTHFPPERSSKLIGAFPGQQPLARSAPSAPSHIRTHLTNGAPQRVVFAHGPRLGVLASLVLSLAACQASAPAFGDKPEAAAANADQLFTALTERFTSIDRTPEWSAARLSLAHGALVPSRVFDDTTLWTDRRGDTRELVVQGHFAGERYIMEPHAGAPLPSALAESRHDIRLHFLGDDQYEWQTTVDMAVGSVQPDDIARVVNVLLSQASRPTEAQRSDYQTAFPRTTASLARLYSLDTLTSTADSDGASNITIVVSLHPERLRATMPAYAAYVEKYAVPTRYALAITDRTGATWISASAAQKSARIQLREKDGHLAPLTGAPRAIPDSLLVRIDVTTHLLFMDVGASNVIADLVLVHTPHERGWFLRFHRPPDWHLPLAAGSLLRTPLRRPFEGNGTTIYFAMRDSPLGATQLRYTSSTVVQESAILRFLSKLSFSAVKDFAGDAEVEATRFDAEVFAAMRSDIRALGGEMP